jgi:hypothetical protein
MALARIISRSRQCSRELALDLLERGYAVEIVSPDAIPDNLADLELRVESGSDDRLTATVEAHNGSHSASLEFIHHLKKPVVDFKRRPPNSSETVAAIETSKETAAAQFVAEPLTLPGRHSRRASDLAPSTPAVAAVLPVLRNPLTAPEQLGTAPTKPDNAGPTVKIIIPRSNIFKLRTSISLEDRKSLSGTPSINLWLWRPTLSFAALVLVALVGFTASRGGNVLPENSTSLPELSPIVVAPEDAFPISKALPDPAQPKSGPVPQQLAKVRSEAPPPVAPNRNSRGYTNDVVARDTVIYLDKPGGKPIPKTPVGARGRPAE